MLSEEQNRLWRGQGEKEGSGYQEGYLNVLRAAVTTFSPGPYARTPFMRPISQAIGFLRAQRRARGLEGLTPEEEPAELCRRSAQVSINYLMDFWGIKEEDLDKL